MGVPLPHQSHFRLCAPMSQPTPPSGNSEASRASDTRETSGTRGRSATSWRLAGIARSLPFGPSPPPAVRFCHGTARGSALRRIDRPPTSYETCRCTAIAATRSAKAHTYSAPADQCAPDASRRLRKTVPKAATSIDRPHRITVTSTALASPAPSGRTAAGSPVRVGLQPRAGPAPTTTKAAYDPIPTSRRHTSRARQPLKRQPPGRTRPEPGPFGNHHRRSHALSRPEADQLPGVHSRSAGERDSREDRDPGRAGPGRVRAGRRVRLRWPTRVTVRHTLPDRPIAADTPADERSGAGGGAAPAPPGVSRESEDPAP